MKIAIISNKPQTTRNRVQSILTQEDYQIVFIDTPGIHRPRHKLGEYMVKSAETTLNEVDAVLMLLEPNEKVLEADRLIIEKFARVKREKPQREKFFGRKCPFFPFFPVL